jgi:xanthine permease
MLVMFGMVISAGIRTLSTVDFSDNGNLLIMACSIAMGLGVTVVPTLFDQLPSWTKLIFGNGIVSGATTAIFLNVLFNHLSVGKAKDAASCENS